MTVYLSKKLVARLTNVSPEPLAFDNLNFDVHVDQFL